ncbi:MAG: LysR substrate-binding domain-containing protein, partial [Vulcanimicrobiaceae bacterium]
MNTRDYEYAIAVAQERSFSRAAKACGVSQPTLSGQIRKLERSLDIEIFERDGHTIRITPTGVAILEQAQVAMAAVERIAELAREGTDPLSGPLRIGFIPTVAPYLLPTLLPAIRRALPRAPVAVTEDITPRLLAAVFDGTLDAAIVATEHSKDGLSEIPLFDEPFLLALPHAHALAQRDRIALREIDASMLILLADGHCLRDQALSLCSDTRTGKNIVADVRATSLETLLHLVRANMGMTIIPKMAIGHIAAPGILLRELSDSQASRRIRV